MKKLIKQQKGFTLTELLVFMGLFSILIVILTDIFGAVLRAETDSQGISAVEEDAHYILTRIAYDMNRGTIIVTPSDIGQTTSTMQVLRDSINYSYSLSGTDLIMTDNIGQYKLNSYNTSVSNLSFKRIGNLNGKNNIIVSFSIVDNATANAVSKDYQMTAGVR